jgi:polar amino acid transport system permease protein
MGKIGDSFFFIGQGLFLTLGLLVGGLCIGLTLGTLLSLARRMNRASWWVDRWVSVLRGTPLILQLSFIYFAVPGMMGIKINVFAAGIFTFGCNSSAYIAEILKSGIEALPKGQFEAAKSLEIPFYFMWKDIILPQVFRQVLPSLMNETISLLKETALIGTIGGMDIMRMAQILGAEQFTYFLPLCLAGVYYYGLVFLFEKIGEKIEKKVSYATH